jgi:hypothetical protein
MNLLSDSGIAELKCFFAALQQEIHLLAVEKGWWGKKVPLHTPETYNYFPPKIDSGFVDVEYVLPPFNDGEKFALFHSELSEGLEALRENKPEKEVVEELADCVIRIMDYCERKNFDLISAILEKHEYNKTRSYKHGGKKF